MSVSIFLLAVLSPRIDRVACLNSKPAVLERLEFKVDVEGRYSNPFDPADVSLEAAVQMPSGRQLSVPGFLYQPFTRRVGKITVPIAYGSDSVKKRVETSDGEILTPLAKPDWRLRFTPTERGRYRFAFHFKTRDGESRAVTYAVQVETPKAARSNHPDGFVRIDPENPRAFRTSVGKSFFPIGANMCWAGSRGTRDYDDWLPKYGAVKANWGRLWLSPMWTTFGVQQPSHSDGIDLANAWRLDYVMDRASAQGIYMTLCVDSYNILRAGNNWPEWDRSAFNRKNGGPLASPAEFWTSPEAARLYRNKLRYLVARWGADSNVFSWEFWNEVDGISDYSPAPVLAWHREMSNYLRSIDPERHLISTSFGGDGLNPDVFALPNIDYSVAHIYDAPDESAAIVGTLDRLKKLGKPTFIEECGADAAGSRAQDDPLGLQLHNPLWTSIASGASAGSMLWWWDSLIAPKNLYPQLSNAEAFLNGVDWGRENFRSTKADVTFLNPPKNSPLRDVEVEQTPGSWSASLQNAPLELSLDKSGLRGGPVAALLHGIRNHRNLHNPVTFVTHLDHPTILDLRVGNVSGYGGAALQVTLDGKPVINETFNDPGNRGNGDLTQYTGVRRCPISSGPHQIVVENNGPDWVQVEYSFEKAIVSDLPPLRVWASVGRRTALVWLRIDTATWRNVIERKVTITPCSPTRLLLSGLAHGRWTAEVWDTWRGLVVRRSDVGVGADGTGVIQLPTIDQDLAVKLVRQP